MESDWNTEYVMDKLKEDTSNNYCFDCNSLDSDWTSVNNGIFLCLNCAGLHRGLGVHISFVRSMKIDVWQEKQLKLMHYGGNSALKDFLSNYALPSKNIEIYKTKALDYYREMLKARAEGLEFNKEQPSPESGQEFVVEESKGITDTIKLNTDELNWQQVLEKFWADAKEAGKNFGDKIKDLTFEDVKGKTVEVFHELVEKIEKYDYKTKFEEIKAKSEEVILSIKESTKHTMENPRESIREKYESSKTVVVETFEKGKAKVIETYESSKVKIKENYHHSVERLSGSELVLKAKGMLGK